MDTTELEYEICSLDDMKSWRRKERRREVLDIINALLYKCHSYHTSKANEQELICMKCMKSEVNTECLLMRKEHQQRYHYCVNIEKTKNKQRKQTKGTIVYDNEVRSLGGTKICREEASVFGYQQWIGQIKHATSEASKQAGY